MRQITIQDIAEECGISKMLVSAVLRNQKRSVRYSEETAVKIRKTAERLGYRPNLLARSLSRRKSDTIGLVTTIKEDGIAYLTETCIAIIETATKNGYSVLALNLYSKLNMAKEIDMLLNRQIEGIITLPNSGFFESEIREKITASGLPWISCFQEISDVDSVMPDLIKCTSLGMEYLCSKGYKHIAFITEGRSNSCLRAEKEYRKTLDRYGLEYHPQLIKRFNHSVQAGRDAMKKLFDGTVIPDAVFVTADILAIGAIRVIRERGLKVPEDIAVLGWDNLQASLEFSDVPLTTIEPGKYEAGQKVCELLLEKIKKGPRKPKTIIIEPKLVMRASC
ncbi:MAG: hypothetical protein A2017_21915 [Lentisphaerae bacterium GWF2_44_16]|nr:MAG: hypothetical protein A2017_21915 [Lentisphaerae bacterium GWF2_44_16]